MTDATGQEVSLIERLRKVPALSRLVIDDGEYSTTYIPIGMLVHRAADKIDEQAAEIERLRAENKRLRDGLPMHPELFEEGPCYLCGYNGPGYYQPQTHPCAARYHAALEVEE